PPGDGPGPARPRSSPDSPRSSGRTSFERRRRASGRLDVLGAHDQISIVEEIEIEHARALGDGGRGAILLDLRRPALPFPRLPFAGVSREVELGFYDRRLG